MLLGIRLAIEFDPPPHELAEILPNELARPRDVLFPHAGQAVGSQRCIERNEHFRPGLHHMNVSAVPAFVPGVYGKPKAFDLERRHTKITYTA